MNGEVGSSCSSWLARAYNIAEQTRSLKAVVSLQTEDEDKIPLNAVVLRLSLVVKLKMDVKG